MGGMGDNQKKKRYITYRVDTLRDKFLASNRGRRPLRENCGEGCWRFVNFCKFCLVCSASLFQVLAPWVLSSIEVLSVLLIYFLGTSRSLVIHELPSKYHFSYTHNLEDIVGLSMTRATLLSAAYAWGVHRVQSVGCVAHRPYLYSSYLLAALCFPYIIIKTFLFRYGSDAVPSAAIFIITGAFTWFHVYAARRTLDWARRSYQMGLAGFGYSWEEGDEAWTSLMRRPDVEEMSKACEPDARSLDVGGSGADVPAESLADEDSRFLEVFGVKVHYKEVVPLGVSYPSPPNAAAAACSAGFSGADGGGGAGSGSDGEDAAAAAAAACAAGSVGVVLIHGYGGGVFSWRHVQETLAQQLQCRVLAFDRPAFGLTSRPTVSPEQRSASGAGPHNPYTYSSQAELMLQLCAQLGLQKVLLVAHADAGLLALRAAAVTAETMSVIVDEAGPSQPGGSRHAFAAMFNSGLSGHGIGEAPGGGAGGGSGGSDGQSANPVVSAAAAAALLQGREAGGGGEAWGSSRSTSLAAHTFPAEAGVPGGGGGGGGGGEIGGSPMGCCEVSVADPCESSFAVAAAAAAAAAASVAPPCDLEPDGPMLKSSASLGSMHCTWGSGGLTSAAPDRPPLLGPGAAAAASTSAGPRRPRHRRAVSAPLPPAILGASAPDSPALWQALPRPSVLGIVLTHPNLQSQAGPTLSRLLSRSGFGRSILRPLLRSEVGEVANRRAWYRAERLTPDVLELYKAPLRVQGWDLALMEMARLGRDSTQADATELLSGPLLRALPLLMVTGLHDCVATPSKVERLWRGAPHAQLAVLPECGQLSHEEVPGLLLQQLLPFCSQVLQQE